MHLKSPLPASTSLANVGDAALVHSGCERLRNLLHLGQDSGDSQSDGRSDVGLPLLKVMDRTKPLSAGTAYLEII